MKKINTKKMEKILKQSEFTGVEKDYKPGEVHLKSSQLCKLKVVNYFGDIHTEVFTVQATPDHQNLVAGCSNGDVKVYNIFEAKLLTIFNTSRKGGFPNTCVRWKPNNSGDYGAGNSDGTIKWFNSHQQTIKGYHENQIGYLCCDYERNYGQWCIFGKENYQLELYDDQTKKLKQVFRGSNQDSIHLNHTNRVFSVKCIPEQPNLFFSGGWDSSIRVWDIRVANDSVRSFYGPTISSDSLDYRKGQLLVGNYQNHHILQLWDFKQGKLIETLDIDEPEKDISYCFTASFAKHSEYDVIGVGLSGSNKVKILKDKKVVGTIKFQAPPLSLDFYRFNGRDYLLVGGVQGIIYAIKLKWL